MTFTSPLVILLVSPPWVVLVMWAVPCPVCHRHRVSFHFHGDLDEEARRVNEAGS